MDYDFSNMCANQIEKIEKRMEALGKAFVKDYHLALDVINHSAANEKRAEIMQEVEDLLRDTRNKSVIFFTECMNKVQKALVKNMKGAKDAV
jgi:hypothetical protein